MITFTRTARFILVAAAVLAIAAPAASAKPLALVHVPSASSTDGYQGTYRPVTSPLVMGSPDARDRVGTVNQVTGIHTLPVATKTVVSTDSFDWTAAAIGAGSVTAAVLIGAGALGLRGRRRMALGV